MREHVVTDGDRRSRVRVEPVDVDGLAAARRDGQRARRNVEIRPDHRRRVGIHHGTGIEFHRRGAAGNVQPLDVRAVLDRRLLALHGNVVRLDVAAAEDEFDVAGVADVVERDVIAFDAGRRARIADVGVPVDRHVLDRCARRSVETTGIFDDAAADRAAAQHVGVGVAARAAIHPAFAHQIEHPAVGVIGVSRVGRAGKDVNGFGDVTGLADDFGSRVTHFRNSLLF